MIWYLYFSSSSPNICFHAQRTSSLSIFSYPAGFPAIWCFLHWSPQHFPSAIEGWVGVFINPLSPAPVHPEFAHVCACWEYRCWVCPELLWPPLGGNFHSGINLPKINIFTPFFLPPDQVFQHTPVIGAPRCSNQNKNLQWSAWIWWPTKVTISYFISLTSFLFPICQEPVLI